VFYSDTEKQVSLQFSTEEFMFNRKAWQKQYNNDPKVKEYRRNKRLQEGERTKRGLLLKIWNVYRNRYETLNGPYSFPIHRNDWVNHFLDNTAFNDLFNAWEINGFNSPDRPFIVKNSKKAHWNFENLKIIPHSELAKKTRV
jgi:hypothetical protein